jgi:hypothetical protein
MLLDYKIFVTGFKVVGYWVTNHLLLGHSLLLMGYKIFVAGLGTICYWVTNLLLLGNKPFVTR